MRFHPSGELGDTWGHLSPALICQGATASYCKAHETHGVSHGAKGPGASLVLFVWARQKQKQRHSPGTRDSGLGYQMGRIRIDRSLGRRTHLPFVAASVERLTKCAQRLVESTGNRSGPYPVRTRARVQLELTAAGRLDAPSAKCQVSRRRGRASLEASQRSQREPTKRGSADG